jgi:hypothetical protein
VESGAGVGTANLFSLKISVGIVGEIRMGSEKSFEYMFVTLWKDGNYDETEPYPKKRSLDELGYKGWELIHVGWEHGDSATAILRREPDSCG